MEQLSSLSHRAERNRRNRIGLDGKQARKGSWTTLRTDLLPHSSKKLEWASLRRVRTSVVELRTRVQFGAIGAIFVVGVLLSTVIAQTAQCAVTPTSTAADVGLNPSRFRGVNWARLSDPGSSSDNFHNGPLILQGLSSPDFSGAHYASIGLRRTPYSPHSKAVSVPTRSGFQSIPKPYSHLGGTPTGASSTQRPLGE